MVDRVSDEIDLDEVFKALSHPIRRTVLEKLADSPEPVGVLAEPYDVSLAAVSRHLHVLEDAGLIEIEKDGQVRRCHLEAAPLSMAFSWLIRYRVFWEDRFDALANHLENEESWNKSKPTGGADDRPVE